MLVLDGVQQGFDFEGREKKELGRQNRIAIYSLGQPPPPSVFLLLAHVGELSSGSLKLGVSGPVKLDPSDDKCCPGAVEQVLQRRGSGAPRRDLRIDTGVFSALARARGASRTRAST